MKKIIKNMVQCKNCGEIITSEYRHDFRTCSCGTISVDGGTDYLRRGGDLNGYIELSVYGADIEVNLPEGDPEETKEFMRELKSNKPDGQIFGVLTMKK